MKYKIEIIVDAPINKSVLEVTQYMGKLLTHTAAHYGLQNIQMAIKQEEEKK